MRKVPLTNGEFYHIFNRGVDKRKIFVSEDDLDRFLESMEEFNCVVPTGSILERRVEYRIGRRTPNEKKGEKLVDIICYCLNPNHFHFILVQRMDNGISEFMKRLSGGYAKYFNEKHKRNGALFQGKFKSVHIESNAQLIYVAGYVIFNYIVHGINKTNKLIRSSWDEVSGKSKRRLCDHSMILAQYKSKKDFEHTARSTALEIRKKRQSEDSSGFIAP